MTVRKIEKIASAAEVAAVFERLGIAYQSVTCLNWEDEYPYRPDFKFAIAHDGWNIYINYKVDEKESRAAAAEDMGNVWEDSCAEFFICPSGQGYYNFECNCIGTLLEAYGEGRSDRNAAPTEVLSSVQRFSSLPHEAFENCAKGPWELSLVIPASAFFRDKISSLDNLEAKINVYKCGDSLSEPHFVTWAPIGTASPDYHRPEFFVPVKFEG